MTQLINQSEFARLQGWDKSHVTRLKQAGRLVMVEGKVDVEASLEMLRQSDDPARQDVKDRHAGQRGGVGGVHGQMPGKVSHTADFNHARARNETAKAELAEMEAAKMRGSMVESEAVRLFAADLGATFGNGLDNLADRVCGQLSPQIAEQVRPLLEDESKNIRHEIADKLEKGTVHAN